MKMTTLAIVIVFLLVVGGFAILTTLASASEGVILLVSAIALVGRIVSKVALLLNIRSHPEQPQELS